MLRVANGFECVVRDFNNYTDSIEGCNIKQVLTITVTLWSRPPRDLINQTRNIHTIDVSGQSLTAIDNKGLCEWPNLTYIDANENNITSLPSDVLLGCHRLTMLSLSKNNISDIYDDAFHGLTSLTNLDLSDNKILSLSGNIFKPLTALKKLLLNDNQIEAINQDHFEHCLKVETLDLSYNQLTVIQRGSFYKLKQLNRLDLSHNPGLNSLDLSEMDRLYGVFVDGDALTNLQIPTYVVKLRANNNKISELTIDPNGALEELYLSNNSFRNIASLSQATQLTELDISYNNITDIDFSYLMSTPIKHINVLENPIKTFNVQALTTLPTLRSIEITTSNLDNQTLTTLINETQHRKIALHDLNREEERKRMITTPPVTPVPVNNFEATTAKPTTGPISIPHPTAAPIATKKPTHTPTPSTQPNSKDETIYNDMLKRIQNLESTIETHLKTDPNQSNASDEHTEMAQSLSNLKILVICTIIAFSLFVSCQMAIFMTTRGSWKIPMPNFISTHHNGRANRSTSRILTDSMDPITEEAL